MRPRRMVTIAVASLVVLLVAVAAPFALRYFNIDAVREVVVQRLEALTGPEVEVRGDFDLVPSLTPTFAAEGVVVANAPWGSRPAMLAAERIEVELQLVPLLWEGDVLIDRLVVVGADLLLETGPEGQASWRFSEEAAPAPGLLIDEVSIQDSRLTWHDIPTGRTETAVVDRFTWQADDATSALTVGGAGEYRSRPFTLSGQLGSLADLFAAADPYPVALEATLGDIEARVEGRVSPDFPGSNTRLEVTLAGEALAGLGDLIGTDLPPLGPYRVQTVLASAGEGGLVADPLRATLGDAEQVVLLRAEGRIGDALAGEEIRLRVEAEGAAVAALGDLLNMKLPALGPYAVQGTLTGSTEDDLALRDLQGTIGEAGGDTVIRVTGGTIGNVLAGADIRVPLQAEGDSVATLAELAGIDMERFGPYTLQGTLVGSLDKLGFQNAGATAGEGLAGECDRRDRAAGPAERPRPRREGSRARRWPGSRRSSGSICRPRLMPTGSPGRSQAR